MAFCKEYNSKTQDKMGSIIPVEITVYEVCPSKRTAPAATLARPLSGPLWPCRSALLAPGARGGGHTAFAAMVELPMLIGLLCVRVDARAALRAAMGHAAALAPTCVGGASPADCRSRCPSCRTAASRSS